ncbi:MAG: Outer membrane protein assembly factor BamD [Candidatus Ordinivivax streblomastigis]|uniref:Outer membrane protein assembly factor BamD n=1 Tax=Candidatus Ordinivivax streblomastigis TaxID=2540710 RepID=A0A5M8P1W6_9BACT|nr:MAG: Outer membrane protein assembly factor BamD [Candidatus Ordinivivax streblomastigis]
MKLKLIYFSCLLTLLTACGEYNKLLKSTDTMAKYEAAKKYFDTKKYTRAATLLEDVVPMLRASSYGGEAVYLQAQTQYAMKDYVTAAEYFKSYYTLFPKGEFAELARYYSAYGLYLDSPDPRLDQTDTHNAMQQFQDFLEYYPQSEKKEIVQQTLFELQEKLAYKELMAVKLYYNLGDYLLYSFPGGNYLSCVITAQNAMRNYPYSKHREEFIYYTFLSKYEIAVKSVEEKKDFRYRDVADEYFSYANEYPQGKHTKEITKLYNNVAKHIN